MTKKKSLTQETPTVSHIEHTGMAEAGTEVWEFSPNDKLQKTMEVINRHMEAMMPKNRQCVFSNGLQKRQTNGPTLTGSYGIRFLFILCLRS